jgi:hypothetical protein
MDEWCLQLDGGTIQILNNTKTHKLEATHFLKFSKETLNPKAEEKGEGVV